MNVLAAAAKDPALTASAISLGAVGALLLLWVVWRTFRTSARWHDALFAVLLGVVIGIGGEGPIKEGMTMALTVIRAVAGFFVMAFKLLVGLF
ncbi:hypothetical protein C1I95_24660 [Micromonospora craterilacus]|uniref:Uncharacterized protein n=1 Tax=Micromonospora craterilacus TaxID=1655439 RepID=A0A2W2DM10_9ACTN|nr:hypothetical protein [Micromonospora craterilacus]PZG13002.1 hypothetical protein C1I95_24660 [Micromonospora craterilacus]